MISTQATLPRSESEALFADVIVPRHLTGPFTYTVPLSLRPILRIGHRVIVPFGRSILQGAVISLSHIPPHDLDRTRLKEIHSLVPDGAAAAVTSNLFHLSKKVAEQYIAPWGQCLRLVHPPALKPRTPVNHYELTEQGRTAFVTQKSLPAKERALLVRLNKKGIRRSPRNPDLGILLHDLVARGWVVKVQKIPSTSTASFAQPLRQENPGTVGVITPLIPNSAMSWAEPLFKALRDQEPARVLVQTSWSDRLSLLQQTVRLVLDRGQTVLIIVGEAERGQWITGLIRDDKTGISPLCFHSGLSDQLKAEMWEQIHRQVVRVVVGTRSAIFLPLTAMGMIWVEGEEDPSLKEPQEPRYHAREVAWLRAQNEQAVLVLSSSHPSLETRAAVKHHGIAVRKLVPSDDRPNIRVVELGKHGRGIVLSQPLVYAIEQAMDRRAGVLLFLNRKGYAGALVCRDCGQVPRCPDCHVALMYSRKAARLRCPYCGNLAPISETCISCSGPRMQVIGEGTERVEEEVNRLFPRATVIRLDGDTMQRPSQAESIWRRIDQGEWDIIVGTQLLLGHRPLPSVGLVGFVQADAGLSVPDFRSAERTYHTLLNAVSLAVPAGAGGQVIVQTYLSSHHAIQALLQNDESVFIAEELSYRTALGYPPAVHLIALVVSGTDEKMVMNAATAWAARLTACSSLSETGKTTAGNAPSTDQSLSWSDQLTVLGPVPSPVPKLRGRYRWQILVKSSKREGGIEAVKSTVKEMERTYQRRAIKFDVDVDPVEMA